MDNYSTLEGALIVTSIICAIAGVALTWLAIKKDRNIIYTSIGTSSFIDGEESAVGVYYLPETELEVEAKIKVRMSIDLSGNIIDAEIIQRDFSIISLTKVDTSSIYCLRYNANIYSNEEVSFGLNEEGLLESLDIVSDNQTSKIVVSILSAPKSIMQNDPENFFRPREEMVERIVKPKVIFKVKDFSKNFKINAWQTVTNQNPTEWSLLVSNEADSTKDTKKIDAGFIIRSDPENTRSATNSNLFETSKMIKGLLFRPKTPVKIVIESTDTTSGIVKSHINGLAYIDKSVSYSIPIQSAPFVRRKQKLIIKNGLLISHVIENPSSALGFITIPINIGKALFSIPAQLISLRIDTTIRRKDFEAAKNNLAEEVIKNKENQKRLKEIEILEQKATNLEINKQKDSLDYEKKILNLNSTIAQTKIDSALEIQRLEKIIMKLKRQAPNEPTETD